MGGGRDGGAAGSAGEGDWDRAGFGKSFRDLVDAMAREFAALRGEGFEPVLRGMVWLEQDVDVNPAEMSTARDDRLARLARRVREETGVADLPIATARAAATFDDEAQRKLALAALGHDAADVLLRVFDDRLATALDATAFTSLFDGKSLTGWSNVNGSANTWRAEDGMIRCTGKPICVLRTTRRYENFVLELEWRHLQPKGNAGVFVWSDPLTAVGQPFTRAIECQVLDGQEGSWFTSDGDVFPIHGAVMTPIHGRDGDRAFPTSKRSRPSPRWNHYRITCIDGAISLAVNGSVFTRGHSVRPR